MSADIKRYNPSAEELYSEHGALSDALAEARSTLPEVRNNDIQDFEQVVEYGLSRQPLSPESMQYLLQILATVKNNHMKQRLNLQVQKVKEAEANIEVQAIVARAVYYSQKDIWHEEALAEDLARLQA